MKEYNYSLIPEHVNFDISTIDLQVQYSRKETNVKVEGKMLQDYKDSLKLYDINITFTTVAEVKCITLDFFEANYTNHKIFKVNEDLNKFDFWERFGYCPDSGFYEVDHSAWLKEKKRLYDPSNTLNLKHYLIVGYDSYVEILASEYLYTIANKEN